jgi:hypothetical protein
VAGPFKSAAEANAWIKKQEQGVTETSDYFRRRQREEDIISGKKPARKKQPAQTSDYAKRREQEKKKQQGVAEGASNQKTFTVVYYSPKTDRNVTKTIKADSESEVWDKLELKGLDVVSVKEQGVAEGYVRVVGPFNTTVNELTINRNLTTQKWQLRHDDNFKFITEVPDVILKNAEVVIDYDAYDADRKLFAYMQGNRVNTVPDGMTKFPIAFQRNVDHPFVDKSTGASIENVDYVKFDEQGKVTGYKQGVAEGSNDTKIASLEKKLKAIQDRIELSRERRRIQAQSGKGSGRLQSDAEIKLADRASKLRQEIQSLKQQGVSEAEVDLSKVSTEQIQAMWNSHKDEERPSPVLAGQLKRIVAELRRRSQSGVSEAKGLKKRVRIVKGDYAGKTGWIREVKHGAFKGAPKTFYIDLDDGGQADNLPGSALRLIKDNDNSEKGMAEAAKKGLYYNVNKRKKAGTSRPKGHPDAPSDQDWADAAKTAKKD